MRSTQPLRIIINADDFGCDAQTNRAIAACFEMDLISSTTVMVNMPGFQDACELSHRWKLLSHIGLHLNLTAGMPLTTDIRKLSRFCSDQGHFIDPRKHKLLIPLSRIEEEVLRAEVKAQIAVARSNGLPLTHLDSHHHVHTFWAIARVVIPLAREMGIKHVRLSRNCGTHLGPAKRAYKTVYNRWLAINGVAAVRYFGSVTDVGWFLSRHGVRTGFSAEIMVHPAIGTGGAVLDAGSGLSLAESLKRLPVPVGEIVSYTGRRWLSAQ